MKLVSEVREGLRQRMMEVDWLDDETRQLSIEKANIYMLLSICSVVILHHHNYV